MPYRFARLAAAAVLILATAACGPGDGPDFTWLRAMHAMPDAPALQVTYENYVFRREVAYGGATIEGGESLLSSSGPTSRMTAAYLPPESTSRVPLLELDVPVRQDFTTTVIFAGSVNEPEVITVVSPRLARPLGAMSVQFAHAALEFGALDVYLTAPDTELTATAPIATVQARGQTDLIEVPFGLARIRLTPAGSLDVLMDSGELDLRETTGATGPGLQWLFAISPSTLAGPSPLFLVASTGRQGFRFLSAGTPAALRAIHAATHGATADIVIKPNPEATEEPEIELYSGLAYRDRTPVLPAPPGLVRLEFRFAGNGEAPAPVAASQIMSAGQDVLALLLGESGTNTGVLFNLSSTQSVATVARLRFANLAPQALAYSIYLTASADEERSDANRLIRDMNYTNSTSHIARLPGSYFLTFTKRDSEQQNATEVVAFGPTPLELAGGDVLTWALFAPESADGPEVLRAFDDRLP
jgi:hypothetical protein